MAKAKQGSGSAAKSKAPSGWYMWVSIALVIVVIAWSSLRDPVQKPTKKSTKKSMPEPPVDERLEHIRDALFTADGGLSFVDGTKQVSGFGKRDYWEKLYAKTKQEDFDWYGTWNGHTDVTIKPHVTPWMPSKVQKVLNVGCGNSKLAQELLADGFNDILSVDIAQSAIDGMNKKFKDTPGLRFMQMDATSMTFDDATFDVVFDKGTLDAMYTGASELVKVTVSEIFRVLRPGGLFVSMTFGPPKSRKDLNSTSGVSGAVSGWQHHEIKQMRDGVNEKDRQQIWLYMMTKPV